MNGSILLNRKIFEWEWWHDINTYRLFTYMILRANWKPGKFKGEDIPRGAFASSLQNLAHDTDLTVNEIRTALLHLESTGEITKKAHSKYTVFFIQNYDLYQAIPQTESQDAWGVKPQPINKLLTTIEESNKEIKNNNSPPSRGETYERLKHNFEIIYGIYPVKKGRTKAFARYQQWLKGRKVNGKTYKLTNEQMYVAVKKFCTDAEEEGREQKYYPHFDTLMGDRLLDYVEVESDTG